MLGDLYPCQELELERNDASWSKFGRAKIWARDLC